MSKLEQIVRPSQSPTIRPSRPISQYVPPAVEDENTISWGSAGNSIFTIRAHVAQTVNNNRNDETQRTYDTVRVTNEDDPSQYIDTEVMTEYQARNKIDDSRIVLRFAKTKPSANVQVLSSGNVRNSSAS